MEELQKARLTVNDVATHYLLGSFRLVYIHSIHTIIILSDYMVVAVIQYE